MGTIARHHAELICDFSVQEVEISNFSEEVSCTDVFIERFGIDDARELIRQAFTRPSEYDTLLLVVRTDFITLEAQNALLKVLEEPPASTKFVFVVPPDFSMLSTLRSRFSMNETLAKQLETVDNPDFEKFINSSYKERLTDIEKFTKEKNTTWQRAIKRGLIEHIRLANIKSSSLTELEYVARTLLTRGASNKMLLEHAALILGTRL